MKMPMLFVNSLDIYHSVYKIINKNVLIIYNIGGKARINSQYGPGAGPILMASVDCSGSEESILECSHRSCNIFSCSHYSDAGVTCER